MVTNKKRPKLKMVDWKRKANHHDIFILSTRKLISSPKMPISIGGTLQNTYLQSFACPFYIKSFVVSYYKRKHRITRVLSWPNPPTPLRARQLPPNSSANTTIHQFTLLTGIILLYEVRRGRLHHQQAKKNCYAKGNTATRPHPPTETPPHTRNR